MGRTAIALGTQDRCSCVVDRSVDGLLFTDERRNGSAALGVTRNDPVLSGAATSADTCSCSCKNETSTEAEVVLPELWCQLELTERQRFGHCFSSLVLKALGHCAGSAREVEL